MDVESPRAVVDFATYYRRETRWSSVLLFAYVGLNFVLAWSYRHWLLGMPAPAPAAIWLLEWGAIIPVCAALIALRARWSESPAATPLTLAGVGAISLAILAERLVWVRAGAPFFSVLNCYFLTAAMVMTGVRFRLVCLVAFPLLAAEIVLSYALYGWGPQANFDLLSFVTAGFILAIAGWQVERGMHHAWSEGRYFETLSQRDPLTGLMNRRGFDERARKLALQAARERRSFALAVLDLDAFKAYNDCYGHLAGDRALIRLAQLLAGMTGDALRFAARIGGEEFVMLWYDADEVVVRAGSRNVVEALRALGLVHQRSAHGHLTISAGAHHVGAGEPLDVLAVLQAADENLYAAKQQGGDCVVVSVAAPAGSATPALAPRSA